MRFVSMSHSTGTVTRPAVVRIGSEIRLAQIPESIYGIGGVPRPVAKRPAALIAKGIHCGHSNDVFQFLELADNDRAMRPRAGPGNVEMITAWDCGVPRTSIRSDPVAKLIPLTFELTFCVLFCRKLRLGITRLLEWVTFLGLGAWPLQARMVYFNN